MPEMETGIQVYWNLHRKCWSIRKNGKVIGHRPALAMKNVEFRVQPAGRERVRREGKKNVHAYAKGDAIKFEEAGERNIGRRITYNPYRDESFVYADDLTPVFRTDMVFLDDNRNVWEMI